MPQVLSAGVISRAKQLSWLSYGGQPQDGLFLYEPRHDKTCLRGFRPGSAQTGLYNHRRWLEISDLGGRRNVL